MKKIEIKRSFLAYCLAGTMVLSGMSLTGCAKKQETPKTENELGYTDINPFFNSMTNTVENDDFVILDMGNHSVVKTIFEGKKAKYCNDNDISLGMIITSTSETESEIYHDVDFARYLIQEYNVDFPIFLNIDAIIENDNLNLEMKTKLIKNFVEKCVANNIYVGLHGKDTNLCRVRNYCGIKEYDAFVVMEKDTIDYEGEYSIYQTKDGDVRSTRNIAETITEKGLNNPSGYTNDARHVIAEGEDLIDIALHYGMSVNEILDFNHLKSKDNIPAGTQLRIPTIIKRSESSEVVQEYSELEEPVRGCDLSYAQGANINWDELNENYDFVILRCTQGTTADSSFESNIINANMNGIPAGAYCYNEYTLNNVSSRADFSQKQQEQADSVINLLKNKKIDYPVYLAIELSNADETSRQLDSDSIKEMIDIWCTKMTESGYIPGISCSQSSYQYLQSHLPYDLTEKLEVWLIGGDQYTGGKKDILLEDVKPSESLKNKVPKAAVVQATDSAIGTGAGNHNGHLNVSYSYRDYTDKTYADDLIEDVEYTDEIEEFDRYNPFITRGILAGTATVGTIAGALYLSSKAKKRKHAKKKTVKKPGKYERTEQPKQYVKK